MFSTRRTFLSRVAGAAAATDLSGHVTDGIGGVTLGTGRLLTVVVLALLAAGCHTGGRPPAATQGSLRDARQSLEGEWTLERFERIAADGSTTAVVAEGRLSYDRFGHMTARGHIDGRSDAPELTYEGRAVINARTRTISIRPAGRGPSTATARVRRYEFLPNDRLQLELVGEGERLDARVVWRRVTAP
jgi:hypothetical protein